MRKIWAYLTICFVALPIFFATVGAANLVDVHWVTRNDAPIPFVRMVLSLSSPVQANASISSSGTTTTVTLNNTVIAGAKTSVTMDDSIAKQATLTQKGKDTIVTIETPKSIDVADLKVFTLKKDTVNNKPYRMVIDIQKKGVAPRENYYGKKQTPSETKPTPTKTVTPPSTKKSETKVEAKTSTTAKESSKKKEEVKKPTKPQPKPFNYRTSGGISGKIIVLDPGHGGSDPGAIGPTGLQEKEVTLPIANFLKTALEEKGAKVFLSRTNDSDVYGPHASGPDELQARVDVANTHQADAFISIHINSFTNPSVGGIATYYFDGSEHSKKLATHVQRQIADHRGFNGDRGIQPGNLYVLRHSMMPSILVELGFISNPGEEKALKDKDTQKQFANEMAKGLETYFGG